MSNRIRVLRLPADSDSKFCVAGTIRKSSDIEAFSMLATTPGADVAPYHDRLIAILQREHWVDWLYGSVPARSLATWSKS